MKALSVEPPIFVKRAMQIILIGMATVINVSPFLYSKKLSYDFYLVFFPLMLLSSLFIISRAFMFKNIYYNDQYLMFESKGKDIIVPIGNVKKVTSYFFQCRIIYLVNNKKKSINFVHNDNNLLRVGSLSRALKDIRQRIRKAKIHNYNITMGRKLFIGFLVCFILFLLLWLFLLKTFRNSFKESPEFKIVENAIWQNKEILKETGGVIEFEDFGGTVYGDSASIGITLKGGNKSILARYKLIKNDTVWEIVGFEMFKKDKNSDKWIALPE